MNRKRRPPGRPNAWTPLQRASKIPPSPEKIVVLRAEAARMGADPDRAEQLATADQEIWMNGVYAVVVSRDMGWVRRLSVRRQDRGPDVPWRDLQRIKNQLAGPEVEAIELFPAESRLVDTANQRWLWCFPPGYRVPVGFEDGRHVSGPEDAARFGAVQAEW